MARAKILGQDYVCIWNPGGKKPTKRDLKTVRNFSAFLRGKGTRCYDCLHKAKNHRPLGCLNCDCKVRPSQIEDFHELRRGDK